MPAPLMIFSLLKKNASSRADDSIPAAEETARASTSGAPKENEEVRATTSVAPEEIQPDSSAPPAPTPTPTLPSASDVRNTKAAEKAAVKKNLNYLHETFNRTWAVLSHIYSTEDLTSMGLKEEFDWSAPPLKKFKKVKVPSLVASSYSSSRNTDENEDLDDTAAGPTTTTDPGNTGAPPST